ncbi:MAG: ABC transporter substrate-binding protein, partial [Dehalococcoidia bacterium]|nr:ABC transporter substrate-binding protein [Dehalococcoidia bacterium]
MNRNKLTLTSLTAFLVTLLLLVPTLTSCTRATAPSDMPVIKVGIVGDMTGPTASGSRGEIWGWEDIAKWANETNYVPGVRFETISYDNRFDVGRSINGYELVKSRGASIVYVQMTGANYALKEKYAQDKIIAMIPPAPAALHPPGWAFSPDGAYADGAAVAYEWIVKDWAQQGKPGKPKMAWLTWDADYGHSGLVADWYARELGIEILPYELYPSPAPTDKTAELLRLREANADYVLSTGPQSAWQVVLKDAAKLGMQGKTKFIAIGNAMESDVLIQLAKEAAEGTYFVSFVASMHEQGVPGVEWLKGIQTKYHGEWYNGITYVRGYLMMRLPVEAIKMAIEKDGLKPEQVNGDTIYQALEKNIKEFDTGGLTGPLT